MKWDGWRPLVYMDGGGVKVRTRTGREVSDSPPELLGLVEALDGRPAVLDAELNAYLGGHPDLCLDVQGSPALAVTPAGRPHRSR